MGSYVLYDVLFYEIELKYSSFETLLRISATCKKIRNLFLNYLNKRECRFYTSFDVNICKAYKRFIRKPIVNFDRLTRAVHFYLELTLTDATLKNFALNELFPTCYYYNIGNMTELYFSKIKLNGCIIEKDISIVQLQTDCSRAQAIAALIGNSLDLVNAILGIKATIGVGPSYCTNGNVTQKIENGVITILINFFF